MSAPAAPPPAATPPAANGASIPPCRTLYLRNLPEKLSKPRLRSLLHAAASPHGRVQHISAEKTVRLRGQAFITFETQADASAALRALHAAPLLGRAASVSYARGVSDRALRDGPAARARREARLRDRAQARAGEAAARVREPMEDVAGAAAPEVEVVQPPHKILFVEGLGAGGVDALREASCRFAGFEEVRGVPAKAGIAFVEFASEGDAAVAMAGLHGVALGEPPVVVKVSYAKK